MVESFPLPMGEEERADVMLYMQVRGLPAPRV